MTKKTITIQIHVDAIDCAKCGAIAPETLPTTLKRGHGPGEIRDTLLQSWVPLGAMMPPAGWQKLPDGRDMCGACAVLVNAEIAKATDAVLRGAPLTAPWAAPPAALGAGVIRATSSPQKVSGIKVSPRALAPSAPGHVRPSASAPLAPPPKLYSASQPAPRDFAPIVDKTAAAKVGTPHVMTDKVKSVVEN
jgi:hypothetical protein